MSTTKTAINIDQQIGLKLMGWTEAPADHEGVKRLNQGKPEWMQTRCYISPTGGFCTSFPDYSENIVQALKVVEEMAKLGWMVTIMNWNYYGELSWSVKFRNSDFVNKEFEEQAKTLPLAICKAAMSATKG